MPTRAWILVIAFAATFSTPALAQCPVKFKLSGSGINKLWKETTNTAWSKMLPKGWDDNGFHFYSQVRDRGPKLGIDTPSDLESEILKQVRDEPEGHPNRRQIVLPIKNDKSANLRVIYDYTGKKNATCQLVTLTF